MANKSRQAKKTQASKKRKAMYSEEVKRIARVRAMTGDPTMTPAQVRLFISATKGLKTPTDHFNGAIEGLRETLMQFEKIRLVAGDAELCEMLKQHTPLTYENITKANEFLKSIDNDINEVEKTYRPVVDAIDPSQDFTVSYFELQPALEACDVIHSNMVENAPALMENIRLIINMTLTDDVEILNKAGVK